VAVTKVAANPHEQSDVAGVAVTNGGMAGRSPNFGDPGYLEYVATVHRDGHITTGEALELERLHKFVLRGRSA
jgi:hypothetical protein